MKHRDYSNVRLGEYLILRKLPGGKWEATRPDVPGSRYENTLAYFKEMARLRAARFKRMGLVDPRAA